MCMFEILINLYVIITHSIMQLNLLGLVNVGDISCHKPLIKMDMPFGQCEHFDQVDLFKSRDFF